MPATGDGGSVAAWIVAVLRNLGGAPNGYNDVAMALWAASEGMPDWANNWLATERGGYGGSHFNSAGVWAYPSFAAGVRANADTIRQSNMGDLAVTLVQARSLSLIFNAINRSPWSPGAQGGRYPIQLFDYISGLVGGATVTPAGIGRPVQEPTQPPVWDWSDHVHAAGAALTAAARKVTGYSQAIRHLP